MCPTDPFDETKQTSIKREEPSKPLHRTIQLGRTMTFYSIQANELRYLTMLNVLMLVFVSIGSGALTYALSLETELMLAPEVNKQVISSIGLVQRVCFVGMCLSYGVVFLMWIMRWFSLKQIKKESHSLIESARD